MKHMRILARAMILSLSLAAALAADTPKNIEIRRIDFKNFSFPWDEEMGEYSLVPSISRWISPLPQKQIRAVRGIHYFYSPSRGEDEREHAPLVSVDSVTYGDLDGDGIEEAAVHLNYSTGGTSNWDFLYIYKVGHDRPKLLGLLESGSRGYGGLVRASIAGGILVLDFADEERRVGDCCSAGFIRVRYRWQDREFDEEGLRERGDLPLRVH
jgi:hypothetical protein